MQEVGSDGSDGPDMHQIEHGCDRGILHHASNEFCLAFLISFSCNALKMFAADASMKEHIVNSGVVDEDESIDLEKM